MDLVPPKRYVVGGPRRTQPLFLEQSHKKKNDSNDEVRRIFFCYIKNGKNGRINKSGSVSTNTNRHVCSKKKEGGHGTEPGGGARVGENRPSLA